MTAVTMKSDVLQLVRAVSCSFEPAFNCSLNYKKDLPYLKKGTGHLTLRKKHLSSH